jgi:hypothetical protein
MGISEVVLRELKNDGNENEELSGNLLPNVAMEFCDFVIILLYNLMSGLVCVRRNCLGDVELLLLARNFWL